MTAPEIVFNRANADKPFMGLTTFSGQEVARKDVTIAKNYLDENELKRLNNLVSAYFDLAENRAMEHVKTTMSDYIQMLDGLMGGTGYKLLNHAGTVSRKQADEKALEEYRVYQEKTISSVEKDYIRVLKQAEDNAKKGLLKNTIEGQSDTHAKSGE